MKNEIKTALQEREFQALKDKHRVILRWATGCGKSKMAIDLVNNAPHGRVLFLVAERAHIKNWQEEFQKWGLQEADVTIICYNSLHKQKGEHYDVIVFDEAHHVFTEKRLEILWSLKADYIYLLSATLSIGKIAEIEDIYGKFIVSTVSLKEAISKEILPDPNVYLLPMELDNTKVNQEIKIGKGKNPIVAPYKDIKKYMYKSTPSIIQCTEKQKYEYLTQRMEYYKGKYEMSGSQIYHNLWVNTGSQRKRFLGELKTDSVRKLIKSLSTRKRFICFCASVAQAETLSKTNTISSKRTSKFNQATIDAFNKKLINRLYAVGMANEGLNLNDIEIGIIVQLDGKERLFIQKFGRSLRAEDPVAYIFYYKDTQDEKYLNNALDKIDSKFIKVLNINQ